MKKSRALLVMVSIVTLIAICLIAMPFIFIGSPDPLFSIHNNDVNEHKVVIEICNSNNESVFKQTYGLAPEASIWQPKPLWMLLELSIPPGDTEEYTFKTTLDLNLTETRQIEIQLWNIVDVELYNDEAELPITIGVETA